MAINSSQIKKIKSSKELYSSLNFLMTNFSWSDTYTKKLFKSLKNDNAKIDFYGFTLNDEEDGIIGVILTLYQGSFFFSGKEMKIINLSSWYILKKYRGYKSIFMLMKITKELSNFVITNFSPNNNAKIILKGLGYKRLKTCTKNFYFYRFIINIFSELINSKISECYSNKNNLQSKYEINYRDSKYISLLINGKTLKLLITESHLVRNFKYINKLNFRVSRLHILWSSNDKILKSNFKSILSFIFYKFRTFIISTHCLDSKNFPKRKIWRYHYYKPPHGFDTDLVLIAGSEYSIKS